MGEYNTYSRFILQTGDEHRPDRPLTRVCGLELFCTFSKVFVVDFSSGKNWNLTKVFVPVEVKFHQPSGVGLPLKFSLESVLFLRVNTTVKAEVQPKFFIPLPDQVTVNGKMNIRFVVVFFFNRVLSLPKGQSLCFRIIVLSFEGAPLG